jgi:hypothetical protein
MIASSIKFDTLWADWFVIILLNIYFSYFYSLFYDMNMKMKVDDNVMKKIAHLNRITFTKIQTLNLSKQISNAINEDTKYEGSSSRGTDQFF